MSDDIQRLEALLRTAAQRPLTEAEQAMLRELLTNEENRAAAVAQQYLQDHYVGAGDNRWWSADELGEIAAAVDQQVARRKGRLARRVSWQQLAWAAASIVLVIGVLLVWPLFNRPNVEPAAVVSLPPTPVPTPTLLSNYQYLDGLLANPQMVEEIPAELYGLMLEEVVAQWDGALYLPAQISEQWQYAGAGIRQEDGVLEFAFVQNSFGQKQVWILSQVAADDWEGDVSKPLPVSYQPLERIDEVIVYDDSIVAMGEVAAYAAQYENVYREGVRVEWTVYRTVTWEVDGQLLTLTFAGGNPLGDMLATAIAENLAVRPYAP